jgi:hypothetical protein
LDHEAPAGGSWLLAGAVGGGSGAPPDRSDRRRPGRRAARLAVIAGTLLVAIINHEYQHDQWIGEVRHSDLDRNLPPPEWDRLTRLDGYLVLNLILNLVIDPTG